MAKINRYTRLTPAQFNPMSLEEQFLVPLALQQKHDKQLEQQDIIAKELYDIQRLNPDDEIATNKILEYQDKLNSLSDKLSKEGINRDSINDFRNIYKDYRYDTSNSGLLGKIQNNYVDAKQKEAETRELMARQGWSQDKINQAIQSGYSTFSGTLDPNGNYNTFQGFNAPNFYDHRKELQSILSQANYDQISVGGSGSYIQFNPSTGFYEITETTPGSKRYNAEQIRNGLNSIITSYSQGDKAEYLKLQGISPEMFKKEIDEIAGAYRFTQEIPGSTNKSYRNPPPKSSANIGAKNTWESNPLIIRDAKDGGNPLGSSLMKNPDYRFINNFYGIGSGTYQDYRGDSSLAGGNYQNKGKTSIEGNILENMILDPNWKSYDSQKDTGSGIFGNGNNLNVTFGTPGLGEEQVVIQGKYNGENYNLTIRDPQIVRMFQEYGTTKEGKEKYKELVTQKRKTMDEFRNIDPYLSNMSDKELAQAYTNTINNATTYMQNPISPNNPDSSYWFATTKKILGEDPLSGNFGNITTKKVRLFNEDGTELVNFQNNKKVGDMKGIDALSNYIMNNEYDDLNEDEKKIFHNKLQNAQNLGITVGDHEFINEVNFSVTDKNGDSFYFKVENNDQLSGKDSQYAGIDDASQMNKYLVEGKSFVNGGKETFFDSNGKSISAYKYFAHIPYNGSNGFEIRPIVVYGNKQFNSLEELASQIDIETLEPKVSGLIVENMNEVNARVAYNIEQYYDRIRQGKTTLKEISD